MDENDVLMVFIDFNKWDVNSTRAAEEVWGQGIQNYQYFSTQFCWGPKKKKNYIKTHKHNTHTVRKKVQIILYTLRSGKKV